MKKVIFTWIVTCLLGMATADAQLLSSKNKDNDRTIKRQKILNKKSIKDPHWKFSEYDPAKSKKEQKQLKKHTKEQEQRSYHPSMAPYYKKKEAKEHKVKETRKRRLTEDKNKMEARKIRKEKKASVKRYEKQQNLAYRKINQNKRNYGTTASRKQFKTTARLTLKDK